MSTPLAPLHLARRAFSPILTLIFGAAGILFAQPPEPKNCIELAGYFFEPDQELKELAEETAAKNQCGVLVLQTEVETIVVESSAWIDEEIKLDPKGRTRLYRVPRYPQRFFFQSTCHQLAADFSDSLSIVYFHLERAVPPPLKLAHITGGTFEMGDQLGDANTGEGFSHSVAVGSFCMSVTEVTNEQYCKFLNDPQTPTELMGQWLDIESEFCLIKKIFNNRYAPKAGFAGHPVIEVTWHGAKAFCDWLSAKYVGPYRLPTEAEWEYAARGGREKNKYTSGDTTIAYADGNFRGRNGASALTRMASVQSFKPNALGLYDMAGNVWEWCEDWYDKEYYKRAQKDNPTGPADSTGFRVLRGGSWFFSPTQVSVSSRGCAQPSLHSFGVGFRVVLPCSE